MPLVEFQQLYIEPRKNFKTIFQNVRKPEIRHDLNRDFVKLWRNLPTDSIYQSPLLESFSTICWRASREGGSKSVRAVLKEWQFGFEKCFMHEKWFGSSTFYTSWDLFHRTSMSRISRLGPYSMKISSIKAFHSQFWFVPSLQSTECRPLSLCREVRTIHNKVHVQSGSTWTTVHTREVYITSNQYGWFGGDYSGTSKQMENAKERNYL